MFGQSTNSSLIRHRKVSTNPSSSFNLETQLVNETLAVDIESSGSNSSNNEVEIVVVKERVRENNDSPPNDDVCPICFGEFKIPVKTNCGHWFCGTVSIFFVSCFCYCDLFRFGNVLGICVFYLEMNFLCTVFFRCKIRELVIGMLRFSPFTL